VRIVVKSLQYVHPWGGRLKCIWLHDAQHSVVTAWLLFAYYLYVLREEVLGADCRCSSGVLDSATGSSDAGGRQRPSSLMSISILSSHAFDVDNHSRSGRKYVCEFERNGK
jgi:hypothetical protein